MIKNRLTKAFVSAVLLSSVAMADTVIYPGYSLIGIESGVTNMSYDVSNRKNTIRKTVGNLGIKIGAESHDYRIFLMANYYTNPDSSYDYVGTYGGQLDYLLNVSTKINLYIGANAGVANIKFTAPKETTKRSISNPYYGVDVGMNFHATKLIDLEFGMRFIMLDAINTKNNVTYTYNNFATSYISINFKYQMD